MNSSHLTNSNQRGSPASWTTELLCFCTAILSLAAIFSLLSMFDGRQQPQWPYASTLNLSALVALLSTLTRSMIGQVLESGMQICRDNQIEEQLSIFCENYVLIIAVFQSWVNLNGDGTNLQPVRFII